MKKLNKLTALITMLTLLTTTTGCMTIKISKDSPALADFGTPIVGHFRNGDTAKGIVYTVLFLSGLIGLLLFSPSRGGNSIIPVSREISDPVYYSFLGFTLNVPAVSSIDTAVTYHLANRQILDLNQIEFDPKGKINKFETIQKYRQQEIDNKIISNQFSTVYAKEIAYYKKVLIEGTVTAEELTLITNHDEFNEHLKNEIGYYNIKHSVK